MSRPARKIDPVRYKRLLSQTMPVVIESEEENERMLAIVEKFMGKGEDLSPEEESNTLAALRDTLLGKLISGELRVKHAEQMIENGAAEPHTLRKASGFPATPKN